MVLVLEKFERDAASAGSFAVPAWRRTSPDASGLSLSVAYLLYGLVMAVFLTWFMPPFQNPDELNHFFKADQISRGQIISDRGGGHISVAIATANYEADTTWTAQTLPAIFPNTAIYPPALYVPAAAAIIAGKAMSLSVIQTLRLIRMTNALLAIAIVALAIALAGAASTWIFLLCALPMSVSVMTSVSQDGLIIALTALACALLLQPRARLGIASILLILIAMAKPPYTVLALALIATARAPRTSRLISAAALLACVLTWTWIAHHYSATPLRTDIHVDTAEQIRHLLAAPLEIIRPTVRSLVVNRIIYGESFIGVLGRMELYLSDYYYLFVAGVLLVFAIQLRPTPDWRTFGRTAAAVVTGGIIFLSLYLVWTEVGARMVDGIQGRYFIPIAIVLALVPMAASRWQTAGCVLFAMVSAGETMRSVATFF